MEEKLYTAAEFAAAIGKTERQVYRYIKSGQVRSLTAKETGLSGTRIPASELDKFMGFDMSRNFEMPDVKPDAAEPSVSEKADIPHEERKPSWDGNETENVARVSETEPEVIRIEEEKSTLPAIPLERYEAAMGRVGYVQAQLENMQRLLTDGSAREKELASKLAEAEAQNKKTQNDLNQKLEAEKNARIQAEQESFRNSVLAEAAEKAKAEAEERVRSLEEKLEKAEERARTSWWKRLFS